MGGAVDIPGNSNTTAEYNWYYDPEGIRICLNAAWKDQLVVPNDIAEDVKYLHNRRGLVIMKKEDDCEMAGRCLA